MHICECFSLIWFISVALTVPCFAFSRMAGGDIGAIPHPGVEWNNFIAKLRELSAREPKVFCPIAQVMKPWIDVKLLNKFYPTESKSASSGCIVS